MRPLAMPHRDHRKGGNEVTMCSETPVSIGLQP